MSNYPDNYQYDWEDVKPECPGCEKHQDDKDSAKREVEKLISILYKGDHVNVFIVHQILEDIAAYVGADFDVEHLPPIVRMNKLGQELYNISSDQIKSS